MPDYPSPPAACDQTRTRPDSRRRTLERRRCCVLPPHVLLAPTCGKRAHGVAYHPRCTPCRARRLFASLSTVACRPAYRRLPRPYRSVSSGASLPALSLAHLYGPAWVYARKAMVEPDGVLSAQQVAERLCTHAGCSPESPLSSVSSRSLIGTLSLLVEALQSA